MTIRVREEVSLKELTTLKIGGKARFFCSASTEEELKQAFLFAEKKRLPIVVLGGGSNVLISDDTIEALVVKIEMQGVTWKEEKSSIPPFAAKWGTPPLTKEESDSPFSKGSTPTGGKDFVLVTAGAGESWDALVAKSVMRGLWGIENLSGIPGTVGAAPIQNIGAYGTEVKEVIEWVEVLDTKVGTVQKLSPTECLFEYRDSIFKQPKGKHFIVSRVALRLRKEGTPNLEYKDLKNYFTSSFSPSLEGEIKEGVHPTSILPSKEGRKKPTLTEIREAVLAIRAGKFPDLNTHGTAGSFFKNPVISKEKFDELKKKYPDLPGFPCTRFDLGSRTRSNLVKVSLAWILDKICNLEGYRKGNVALFERQPIVLVQNGAASSEEIHAFAKEVIRQVQEKTGIEVEWEVAFIGDKSHPARDAGSIHP